VARAGCRDTQGRDALATAYLNYALSDALLKTPAVHIIQCGTIDINPKLRIVGRRDLTKTERDLGIDSVIPAQAGIQISSGRNRPQIAPICSFGILIPDLIFSHLLSLSGR
jgi:hypothetical protein